MTLEEMQDLFEQYQKANYPKLSAECARNTANWFYMEKVNGFTGEYAELRREGLAQMCSPNRIQQFIARKMITELRQIWDEYESQLEAEGM